MSRPLRHARSSHPRSPARAFASLALALALTHCGTTPAQPTTPEPAPVAPARDVAPADAAVDAAPPAPADPAVAAITDQLRALSAHTPPSPPSAEVPTEVRAPLLALRRALRELVTAEVVAANPTQEGAIEGVYNRLMDRLTAAGIPAPNEEHEQASPLAPLFGGILGLAFERPPEAPSWLAVLVTFAVGCGTDSALYVFNTREGHYAPVLADEARNYDRFENARSGYIVALTGAGLADGPYLLALDTPVDCTAPESTLRYRVLRATPNVDAPEALLETSHRAYMQGDSGAFGDLTVERDGFRLQFSLARQRGTAWEYCPVTTRYRVTAGSVRVTTPVPASPRGCRAIPRT